MTFMDNRDILHAEKVHHQSYHFDPWLRGNKHLFEELHSDEEVSTSMMSKRHELEPADRLKELHESMRGLIKHSTFQPEQAYTRKRRFEDYSSSPDYSIGEPDSPNYKLSQFAFSASEQEPLDPEEEDAEEILVRLRHCRDWHKPDIYLDNYSPQSAHTFSNTTNKASLFHILTQDEPFVYNSVMPPLPLPVPKIIPNVNTHNSSLPSRRYFFDEEHKQVESSDEDLFLKRNTSSLQVKKKAKKTNKKEKGEFVMEKIHVVEGQCFKTQKPKIQREYYYPKLSKTIFRWTCCGSQAKVHPDADS